MKLYDVECRRDCNEIWDNWYGDDVEAEDELHAVEYIKAWILEQCVDIDDVMFQVKEVHTI